MRAHMTTPCENCPYRMDAPRKLWHRTEFDGVLAAEHDPIGRIFSCHKQKDLRASERGMCAGWLLDQKKRDLPSIALRLALTTEQDSVAALEAVKTGGAQMFKTIEAMCLANGVRAKPRVLTAFEKRMAMAMKTRKKASYKRKDDADKLLAAVDAYKAEDDVELYGQDAPRIRRDRQAEDRPTDSQALDAIQRIMSGRESDSETISDIADIVRKTGRKVKDVS